MKSVVGSLDLPMFPKAPSCIPVNLMNFDTSRKLFEVDSTMIRLRVVCNCIYFYQVLLESIWWKVGNFGPSTIFPAPLSETCLWCSCVYILLKIFNLCTADRYHIYCWRSFGYNVFVAAGNSHQIAWSKEYKFCSKGIEGTYFSSRYWLVEEHG